MTLLRPFDLIIVFLILIAAGLALYFFQGVSGNTAHVYLGSKKVASFQLNSQERIREIETRIGTIRIRVGKGSIQVLSSPCDRKICVLTGEVHHTRETIICLPTQMVISITNDTETEPLFDRIDAISY